MGPKSVSKKLHDARKIARERGVVAKQISVVADKISNLNEDLARIQELYSEKSSQLFMWQRQLDDVLRNIFEVDLLLSKLPNLRQSKMLLEKEFSDISKDISNISKQMLRKRKMMSRKTITNALLPKSTNAIFTISNKKGEKRKWQPTTEDTLPLSKHIRCNETFQASTIIHGGSKENSDPVLIGLIETLTRKFSAKKVVSKLVNSKHQLTRKLEDTFANTWQNMFHKSPENKLRSLSVYYSHNVMGKRKYRAIRKANRNSLIQRRKISNFVSYEQLVEYIHTIPIGCVKPICKLLQPGDPQEKIGCYRDIVPYIKELARMYLELNKSREDKLLEFEHFEKKDQDSFLFVLSFGGDGAPGVGTVFSITFLNVGKRLSSSKETFIVFGGDVPETASVVKQFVGYAVKCFKALESDVFLLRCKDGTEKKVEFKLNELPNDMKMMSFLAGELSNAAKYFTTFADVSTDDHREPAKSFGLATTSDWKPIPYHKRIAVSKKVEVQKKKLNPKNAETTNRTKITSYIASLKSRQELVPLVREFIMVAKCEPLHLKNNAAKEYFLKVWKVIYQQCDSSTIKSFCKLPVENLFSMLVMYTKKTMQLNQLSKKMISWYNETNRGIERDFSFRFRGEEVFGFLTYSAHLMKKFISLLGTEDAMKRFLQLHYQLVLLRKIVAYCVRLSHFTVNDLSDMKLACHQLFRASCLFETSTSPSLWVITNVAQVHAEQTLKMYGLGLGVTSMEAREQKHQQVKKYAENSTVQNKWEMVFRHEYLQNVYLREHGFDEVRYHKKGKQYLPTISDGCCLDCGLTLENNSCYLCSHRFMPEITSAV